MRPARTSARREQDPTPVPESAEVERGDELDTNERARLHAELRAAWGEAPTASTISAEDLLEELAAIE